MFKARLFRKVPDSTKYLAIGVLLRCFALMGEVACLYLIASLLSWTVDQAIFLLSFADDGAVDASSLAATVSGKVDVAAFALVFVLLVLVSLACRSAAGWFLDRAAGTVRRSLLKQMFFKLVELGAGYKQELASDKLCFMMGEGIARIVPYVSSYVPQLFFALIAPCLLTLILCPIDAPAALLLLVCVPAMPVSIMMLMRRAKGLARGQWSGYVDLSASFKDALEGMVTLKVFDADARKQKELDAEAENFRALTMKLLRMQLGNVVLMDLCAYGAIALAYVVVLLQLAFGVIDARCAFFVLLVAPSFFLPMRKFGAAFHVGMNAGEAIDDVRDFLDLEPRDAGHGARLGAKPSIVFKDASFSYDGKKDALRSFDLKVASNSLVGLTGPSGSGKSTVAKLLAGQITGYRGSITVNGAELRDLDQADLRGVVSIVGCESHVFKGSIRSNLALAKPDAADGEFWWALNKAHLDDFVLSMGGLDSPVLAGGLNLSGGQRQRLCFARALLRDTPIYVFDEVAANVDAESERLMAEAIQQMSFGKTVLVISHRLSDLVWTDEVNVVSEGKLVQRGPHSLLVKQEGVYRRLWSLTQRFEAFAAQARRAESEGAELSELERTMAGMPQFAAMHMQAALDARAVKRYEACAEPASATGHPAWIPLPAYVQAALDEKAGPGGRPDPDAAQKSGGEGFAGDASRAGAAIKDASESDASARAASANVTASGDVSASSGILRTLAGLLRLTRGCHRGLIAAVALGFVGKLCSCGVLVFATLALAAAMLSGSSDFLGPYFATIPAGVLAPPVPLPAALAACVACAVLRGFVHYGERLLTHDQTFKTLAQIRSRVFEHLRALAPARFVKDATSALLSCVTSDIEELEGFYSKALAPVLSCVLVCLACLGAMACVLAFSVGPKSWACVFALIGFALLAFLVQLVLLPCLLAGSERDSADEQLVRQRVLGEFIDDSVQGFSDLLAFERADQYAEEIAGHLDSEGAGKAAALAHSFRDALPGAVSLAFSSGFALALCLVAGQVLALLSAGAGLHGQGIASVAFALLTLACAVFALFHAVLPSAEEVASLGTSLRRAFACAKEVLSVMDEPLPAAPAADPLDLRRAIADVPKDGYVLELDDVGFSFEGKPLFEHVDMALGAGVLVRVSGASGVGKSTLLRLIDRFWDVSSGCILVAGHDIAELPERSVRRAISYMVQDTYLFKGTLRDNIALGAPDASDDEIMRALEKANAAELLEALPQGLDTQLESCGFSSGERQRIGLARTLLYDAPLMLLDEPTSNLDAQTEAAILLSLREHCADKTILLVSHRPASMLIVDASFPL